MNIHDGTIYESLLTTSDNRLFSKVIHEKWYTLCLTLPILVTFSQESLFQWLTKPVISVLRRRVSLDLCGVCTGFGRAPLSMEPGWFQRSWLTQQFNSGAISWASFSLEHFSSISRWPRNHCNLFASLWTCYSPKIRLRKPGPWVG